jgi:hypothetical protein
VVEGPRWLASWWALWQFVVFAACVLALLAHTPQSLSSEEVPRLRCPSRFNFWFAKLAAGHFWMFGSFPFSFSRDRGGNNERTKAASQKALLLKVHQSQSSRSTNKAPMYELVHHWYKVLLHIPSIVWPMYGVSTPRTHSGTEHQYDRQTTIGYVLGWLCPFSGPCKQTVHLCERKTN